MADSKSNDSIEYDEYLDGGIPDALLEGLGFYANSGDMETTSEPDERPESETTVEPPMFDTATSMSSGVCDIPPVACHRGRPPKWPKYTHLHLTKSECSPTTVSPATESDSTRTPTVQFPSCTTGDNASKTVVKGNIMYKRTETGEVIASVIRNGPKSSTAGTVSSAASTNRGRPLSETGTTASLCIAGEPSLSTDYPVNETNVESILDESIAATQSMRRTLVSLKDDLRRMGGGAVMSPSLKPIHVQHRINIAYKLARAFADYRGTMSAVSSGRSVRTAVTSSASLTCPQTATVTRVTPSLTASAVSQMVAVTRVTPTVTMSAVNSAPVTCSSQQSTPVAMTSSSSQKIARSQADTVLKLSSTDVIHVVSDDLLMSCEAD